MSKNGKKWQIRFTRKFCGEKESGAKVLQKPSDKFSENKFSIQDKEGKLCV